MNKFDELTQSIVDTWMNGMPVPLKHGVSYMGDALANQLLTHANLAIQVTLSGKVQGKEGFALLTQTLRDMLFKEAEEIAAQRLGFAYVDDCRKHYEEIEE
jgi:hypothetical protein